MGPVGAEALLFSPGPDVNTYTDDDAGVASYYYRVTASNGNGPGASSARVILLVSECVRTGARITVLTDGSDDVLDQQPWHDIRLVHIAEASFADGSRELASNKMCDLSGSPAPNTQWRVYF